MSCAHGFCYVRSVVGVRRGGHTQLENNASGKNCRFDEIFCRYLLYTFLMKLKRCALCTQLLKHSNKTVASETRKTSRPIVKFKREKTQSNYTELQMELALG